MNNILLRGKAPFTPIFKLKFTENYYLQRQLPASQQIDPFLDTLKSFPKKWTPEMKERV